MWLCVLDIPAEHCNCHSLGLTGTPDCPCHAVQMDTPAADVHGGFVLRLKWLRGADESDVTSSTSGDGTSLFIDRTDATNVDTSGASWKVRQAVAGYVQQRL